MHQVYSEYATAAQVRDRIAELFAEQRLKEAA